MTRNLGANCLIKVDRERYNILIALPYKLALLPGNLAKLKFKCLNTIVSLLECNESSDSLILRIIRAIPLSVLTNNLSRIYFLFQKYHKEEYREEIFNLSEAKTESEDEQFEFIIENGFFIFIIMQFFLSNKKGKELLYEDTEMNDVLNEFQSSKEAEGLDSLLKGNILGEFSKLGSSLFKSGLGAMKKMGQKMGNVFKTEDELRREEDIHRKVEQQKLMKKSISFFRQHTCNIDMVRDDKIYTVYFPKLPFCKLLPKDAKVEFHDDVDRTSSKTKLTYLMDETEKLIKIM